MPLTSTIAAEPEPLPHTDSGDTTLPASFAQERLWFLHRVEPGSPLYNIPLAYDVSGPLDVEVLRESILDIIRRHESLRTNFVFENGELLQVIHEDATFPLEVHDLSTLPDSERETRAAGLARTFIRKPFDLSSEPLLRVVILKLGEDAHQLVLNIHHTVFDGVSLAIFFPELAECYGARLAGREPELEPLPIQYGDFAVWQREALAGPLVAKQVAFWKDRLREIPPPLDLPTDRQPSKQPTSAGGDLFFTVPAEVHFGLRDLCQSEGVTLFMALTAAFQALLFRYTGQERMLTGAPVANRGHAATDRLIGLFVNTVVLRGDFSDDPTVRGLLRRVREETLSAIEHGDLPFEKLVQELQIGQRDGRNPLFRTMLVLQNHGPVSGFHGLRFEPKGHELNAATLDLLIEMIDDGTGLRGGISYSTDLFDRTTIERLAGHFQTLLRGMVEKPDTKVSRLPLLTASDREQLFAWNRTDRDFPSHETLGALFDQIVERSPDATAIVDGNERVTYAALKTRADAIACDLQGRGFQRGSLVGVPAERSARFVSAVLGIVKAGAAYVPIATDEPDERAEIMRSQCACVLSFDNLPTSATGLQPAESALPTDPAYVMFTSGSTGVPKGVLVPHRAINRLVINNDFAPLTPRDAIAFASNACFDAATFEIWGALLNGASLIVVPRDILLSTADLAAFLTNRGVTTLFLTTALFNQIARQNPATFRPLKHLLFGGEACNPDCIRSVLKNGAPQRLLHVYGPTETTTFASWHLVQDVPADAVTVPIGQPIANTTIHILNSRLDPAPVGVTGEIFIGGPGVAIGYLNDPALTSERFIATQFGRLYRTGDLARRRADGAIEFRSRADSQLKLRGFRVEPGEIAAVLQHHPQVREAAIVPREDTSGGKSLVGYLVPRSDERPGSAELREFLATRLPAHMIPAAFLWLDALPLTANGKLDFAKLPAPDASSFAVATERVIPRNKLELGIAEIWQRVLGRDQSSVLDDFFAVGGHSLLGLQLLASIRDEFGVEVPARRLFETPTIEGLARYVSEHTSSPKSAATHGSLVLVQRGDPGRQPLFLVPGGWGGEIEFLVYGELSRQIDPTLPIWGLKARGAGTGEPPHTSVTEMATDYLREVRQVQPHGPYFIAGECVGGICAHEMACQLERSGETVALLVLLDTIVPAASRVNEYLTAEAQKRDAEPRGITVQQRVRHHLDRMAGLSLGEKFSYLFDKAAGRPQSAAAQDKPAGEQHPRGQKDYPVTLMQHRLAPLQTTVTLLLDAETSRLYGTLGWENAPVSRLETHVLPGDHLTYIRESAATAAAKLRELLRQNSTFIHS